MIANVDISVVMPCWKRPQGTRQMIADIFAQTSNGWELNLVGDCCDDFECLTSDVHFLNECDKQKSYGNVINFINLDSHGGGSGYMAINKSIEMATRSYTVFVANDDRISPIHLQNYYSAIHNSDFDMIMFESIIKGQAIRVPELQYGKVGHSEIIVKTSTLKATQPHDALYGHDWNLIVNIVKSGAKIGKDNRNLRTYYVQRLQGDPDCQ